MSLEVLSRLEELKPESNVRLSGFLVNKMRSRFEPRMSLVNPKLIRNGSWGVTPKKGLASLLEDSGRRSVRKVLTIQDKVDDNFSQMLNSELLKKEGYPVLTTVLGTVAGVASFGAGLLFAASTTVLANSSKTARIIARAGDELWMVEEIGQENSVAVHVQGFWLSDPYRGQSATKGWLIHEERSNLIFD